MGRVCTRVSEIGTGGHFATIRVVTRDAPENDRDSFVFGYGRPHYTETECIYTRFDDEDSWKAETARLSRTGAWFRAFTVNAAAPAASGPSGGRPKGLS